MAVLHPEFTVFDQNVKISPVKKESGSEFVEVSA